MKRPSDRCGFHARVGRYLLIILFAAFASACDQHQPAGNPFPNASHVRLFVDKGRTPDGGQTLDTQAGHPLTARQRSDFEAALHITQAPKELAACFIPHHFFRYYDQAGKQVGEVEVCFCCEGVATSEGSAIRPGRDQILSADYSNIADIVRVMGEPVDVLCD